MGALPSETFEDRSPRAPQDQDAAPIFQTGEILMNTYEIRSLLGQGGMAQVFEAHDRWLNRRVAIKAARRYHDPVKSGGSDEVPSPLRREAQALVAVRHPALVTVHGFGVHRGVEFMVMERIHGMTLEAHINQRHRTGESFSIPEVVDILVPLAEALAAVDRAGGAHRDVKPANVMIAPGNRVVLTDFGIFQAEAQALPTLVAGTPHYMAPEAIRNKVALGGWHLIDLYALGVLAFELVAGRKPYDGASVPEIFEQHLSSAIPDIGKLRHDVPPPLRRLIAELMAKSPEDRPASAEVVARRLRNMDLSGTVERRPYRVLVVDDDPDMAELVRLLVEQEVPHAQVSMVSTADAALQVVHRRMPDAILLDLQMPGMNGLEMCMYLRGNRLAEHCSIVAVSGAAEVRDEKILAELGVNHFIRKGRSLDAELRALIRKLAAQR